MFCKQCGCHIPATSATCLECRAKVPELEYCSGFWIELNQNSAQKSVNDDLEPAASEHCEIKIDNPKESPIKREEQEKRTIQDNCKKRNLAIGLLCLVFVETALIIVMLLILLSTGSEWRKKTHALESEIARVESEVQEVQETMQTLKKSELANPSLSGEQPNATTQSDVSSASNDSSQIGSPSNEGIAHGEGEMGSYENGQMIEQDGTESHTKKYDMEVNNG